MRWSTLFFVAISLAGCKKEPASTPQTPAATTAAEAPEDADESASVSAPTTTKLLEPGKKPRRTLRWSIEPGLRETVTIKVDSQSDGRLAVFDFKGKPHSVTFELTVRTNEEDREEALPLSFTIDKASAEPIEGLAPEARKSWESAMERMQGLHGRYELDSLGAVQDVELDLPSDPSGVIPGVAEDLKWALRQFSAPFPKEPIGMGATWTVSRGVKQDGVHANEVSTFETTKLGQLVSVKANVQQSADPQTLHVPGSAVDFELIGFTGQATGEITWDLTQLTPRTAKMTSTVTRRAQYQFEGKPISNVIVTRRTLSIPEERKRATRR